ncbi:MAG: MBL fold metallo-hydrolase, partial [Gemmatimonadota bacterium]
MRLRFLGTGTSFGVPVVGCDCATCTSKDPRDRRTRHAAIIESDDGHRLLIDTPPELRLQLIAAGVPTLDAVWFTHCHADHVQGIDDLRAVSVRRSDPLRIFAGPDCAETLRHRFEYIFDNAFRPPPGTSRPELHLETIDPAHEVRAAGMKLRPAC